MLSIATMTFHHAHNFGSMLQAYALQKAVKDVGLECNQEIDYKIIDLHTKLQEKIYSTYKPYNSVKNVTKNLQSFRYNQMLRQKHLKFEEFLSNKCNLTRRYYGLDDLKNDIPLADVYISGSDQLWNVRATDFDSSYYMDFLPNDAKRISYAASMGPLMIDWNKYPKDKYSALLNKYDFISVREENTKKMVEDISGCDSEIHVDPTLLLTKEKWLEIASEKNYNNGEYIFFYSLEPNPTQLNAVKRISKILDLPVVITKYCNKYDYFNPFIKCYDSGPEDFLALINNAKLVITSSFHGTAFSVLFQKPFFVFGGMKDNRISTLLNITNLQNRSIGTDGFEDMLPCAFEIDFSKSVDALEYERKRSREYLKQSLGI